jgi:16S rRNA C967 or C1407 C5-methylase (RsmB/RsmF family)
MILCFIFNYVLDGRPRYVRVNTLTLKVRAAMKIFSDEGWKQVYYSRKAEDYSSFLHRIASLANDEFIQDLHIKDLFIFPNKTEFFKHPLYIGGSIILQDKVSMKDFLKKFCQFFCFFFLSVRYLKFLHFCISLGTTVMC